MSLLSFPSLSLLKSGQSGRKSNICSVAWHPAKNEAAFCDLTGHWGLVHEVRAYTAAAGETAKEDAEDMEALFNDDDEEDENSFSIGKVLASTGFAKDQDGNLTFGAGEEEGGRPDSALSGASVKETRVIREVVKEKMRLQPDSAWSSTTSPCTTPCTSPTRTTAPWPPWPSPLPRRSPSTTSPLVM